MLFSKSRGLFRTAAIIVLLALALTAGCSWFGGGEKPETKAKVKQAAPEPLRCPLCGLPASGLPAVDRRPIAVKIENDAAARPQSGLDTACVVYEEIVEGGITRFMAVFLCRDAAVMGPVRSARPVDIELAFPFNPLFCHCGGGDPVLAMIRASGLADLDEQHWPGSYWRSRDRRAPHNLYTSTERLYAAGNPAFPFHGKVAPAFTFMSDERQADMERERAEEMERARAAAESGSTGPYRPSVIVVSNVHVPYGSGCAVKYSYDQGSGRFMRYIAGAPHTDMQNGRQLAADTVVVQCCPELPSGIVDVNGAVSPELGVIGSGRAQVFVRGRMIDANWTKGSRAEHTRYTDNAGKVIQFKPGVTWVQLVPAGIQATFD